MLLLRKEVTKMSGIEVVKFLGREMKRQSEIEYLLGEKPMSVLETKARIVLRVLFDGEEVA